ncbi:MAG: carbohydrate ABC transporter permease [Firmicutes bacterium]|nr:carbohydrate ABC transporter permease [Bacillota bacterium]
MRKNRLKKHHEQLSAGDVVFNILNYAFFLCFTLICFFPFYYLFINTVSTNSLVQTGKVNFYPMLEYTRTVVEAGEEIVETFTAFGIQLSNYASLIVSSEIVQAFEVTISRTILGTALMVLASALVGYVVTKKQMWHRKFWYRFLIITMYFNAGTIPWYMNMKMLGLTDNFLAYIIPSIVAPYNIILVKTYIESIPAELEESAFIDGAGYWAVFSRIVLPLCKPILATIAIFGAVGHWNSFTDSLILMQNNPSMFTLQHRLYIYLNQSSNLASLMQGGSVSTAQAEALASSLNNKVIKYTVSMVSVIPILCVYPFMQRYFEKGIMLGAVKG